jgi:hypothetical protein
MSNPNWSTFTTNPMNSNAVPSPNQWLYFYNTNLISSSSAFVTPSTWTNTSQTINNVYVVVVGNGGSGGVYGVGDYDSGGGGGGGGQTSLFLIPVCNLGDYIQLNYYDDTTGYATFSYFSDGTLQNPISLGIQYYNIPDYATGYDISSITFDPTLFTNFTDTNPLLIGNTVLIYYGDDGDDGDYSDGGDGGDGGGGSGGGGAGPNPPNDPQTGNGSRGTQNINYGTYGGMKGGTEENDSSDYRYAGFTPICWPDGTATNQLGNAGKGGDDGDDGDLGNNPSAMIFFQTFPPQIIGINNLSYEFILLNGYYIITITGGTGGNGTIIFNQTIPDFTMNVILVGGGGAGGANAFANDSYGSVYVGGGGGAGGATLQTTLSSSVGQISVNIGAGGISNTTTPISPTSTSITYGSTTLTANPGANGGNAVYIPPADTDDDLAVFTAGSGGGGANGGGSGGDGYGASYPALATNGTSVDINGITYSFGGGGAGGGDDESEYGGTPAMPFGTGGLGGGGGNYNGSTVNTGYEYIYTYDQNPPSPTQETTQFSNNGLPNSGGGGAGADALINGSTEITPGYNGGSGVLILYFPATN